MEITSSSATAFDLASRQHGIVAAWQLQPGVASATVRFELARSGRWRRVFPQVFQLVGAPTTQFTAVAGALLAAGPGAHLAYYSAAHLWGWLPSPPARFHIRRERGSNGRDVPPVVRLHLTRNLPDVDVVKLHGLPIARPERTLIDLAAKNPDGRVEVWLDRAWSKRQLNGHTLLAQCERLGIRGRPEDQRVRRMLDKRGLNYCPPASGLESRVRQVLSDHGLGDVTNQVDVSGANWIGRVDFLHSSGVVIEVQSETYHAPLSARASDKKRLDQLCAAGHAVFEVWERDVWGPPPVWIEPLRNLIVQHTSTAHTTTVTGKRTSAAVSR